MRKHWLGLLVGFLILATAPGCRTLATAGVVAGTLAADWAASCYDEEEHCDHHSAAPPMYRCR